LMECFLMRLPQCNQPGQVQLRHRADMRRMSFGIDHMLGNKLAAAREWLDRIAFARLVERRPKGWRSRRWRRSRRDRGLGRRRLSSIGFWRRLAATQSFNVALDIPLADP